MASSFHCPYCKRRIQKILIPCRTCGLKFPGLFGLTPFLQGRLFPKRELQILVGVFFLFFLLDFALRSTLTAYSIGDIFYFKGGEWWRLFTPIFFHQNVYHLLLNLFVLYFYGREAKQLYGLVRVSILFLGSQILGHLFAFALQPERTFLGPSAGIIGLMAANYSYYFWNFSSSKVFLHRLFSITFYYLIITLLLPNLAHQIHFGGALGGVLFAAHLGTKAKEEEFHYYQISLLLLFFYGVSLFIVFGKLVVL